MIRQVLNILLVALIGAGGYYFWTSQSGSNDSDEAMAYAEQSCIGNIRSRFDITGVKANSVRRNQNGYVVRASMTLSRGGVAKVTCLTNANGTVEDVIVEER